MSLPTATTKPSRLPKLTRVSGSPELRNIADKELVALQERVGEEVTREHKSMNMDELLDRVSMLKQRQLEIYLEVCWMRLNTNHSGELSETMDEARNMVAALRAIIASVD